MYSSLRRYLKRVQSQFISLLIILSLAACGGGQDGQDNTVIDIGPSSVAIVFEDMGALTGQAEQIGQLITSTHTAALGVLPIDQIEFVLKADAARTIPGWGIGGYTLSPDTIEIVIDPAFQNLESILNQRLPYIVAHELHHTVRWRSRGVYTTLLEALVFEGLADDFALVLLDAENPPWLNAFAEEETSAYLERAMLEFDAAFDFEMWFFGINTDLPQWTGYTLGFQLVEYYRALNPDVSLDVLSSVSINEFRDLIDDVL